MSSGSSNGLLVSVYALRDMALVASYGYAIVGIEAGGIRGSGDAAGRLSYVISGGICLIYLGCSTLSEVTSGSSSAVRASCVTWFYCFAIFREAV